MIATQAATRHYAKRQLTWFRREADITWFEGFGDDPHDSRSHYGNPGPDAGHRWGRGDCFRLRFHRYRDFARQGDTGKSTDKKREKNMDKQPQNIQDGFLNSARKEKILVTVYLLSGVKLTGRIRSFDKYSLILESNHQEQMVFKHAVATVVLPRPAPVPAAVLWPRRDRSIRRLQVLEKAFLAGWESTRRDGVTAGIADAEDSLRELKELTASAGARVVGTALQRSSDPDPATLLGRGKVHEVRAEAHAAGADLVIFDHDLTPTQLRNLEKILDLKVIDRTQIILDIFARRARSREGQLQVELAQLNYLLPRLSGHGTAALAIGRRHRHARSR